MENKKKLNVVEWVMKYRQITLAVTTVIMLLGVFALMNMSRNEFPEFTVRQGLVIAVYPGASSDEVEDHVTKEVENYIFGYKEVNKEETYSISKEGQMIIFVTLNDDVKNADQVWSKLRLGLADFKSKLPVGVLALIGNNDFGDTAALLYTISSPIRSNKEIEKYLDNLKAEIRKVETVSKIKTTGIQKEKIYVHIQPEKLSKYSIQPLTVMAAFQMNGSNNYAGSIDNAELVYPIHVPDRFEDIEDLKNQIIFSDPTGSVVRLKDVAYIERKVDEDARSFVQNNGASAIVLSLEMTPGNNIVAFGKDVDLVVDNFKKTIPSDIKIVKISDLPTAVDNSVSNFLFEFLMAILSVILVTMLLLPLRVAGVAAITIPVSVFITTAAMYVLKVPLDTVTLASLIVVLGMIVDNAIVIIDNHVELLDHGETPWKAALISTKQLFMPVLVATLAIMGMFWPMYFFLQGGMVGDFVRNFPLTISLALLSSLVVAAFLVPLLCFAFIKKGVHGEVKSGEKKRKSLLDILQVIYDRFLEAHFRHSWIAPLALIASVVIAVLLFPQIPQRMFPDVERNQFAVEFSLPAGTSLDVTEELMGEIEKDLLNDSRVTNVASFIGSSSPRFFTLYAPKMPSSNYGQMLVNTSSEEATLAVLDDFRIKYANYKPDVRINFKQLGFATTESPVEVRVKGDNIEDIKSVSEEVKTILENDPNALWVGDDWKEPVVGINVVPNRNQIDRLGISKGLLSTSMLLSTSGIPLTTIWEGDYGVDVVLTQDDSDKNSISALGNQEISSLFALSGTPLRAISELEPEWQEGQIMHRNGRRTITCRLDPIPGAVPSESFKRVREKIDKLELPEGVEIDYGGEYEMQVDVYGKMVFALGSGIVLIFFILLFKFKSVRRTLLIMATMPISLIGAVLGLLIVGYPFSMTAFIGILGLMGMVVRNGIILVDYVDILIREQNMNAVDAALAAGKRRMRPIFLTAAAAAVGVVPMIMRGSPLWGPLGTVLCFGLLLSMVLTLLILPVLYGRAFGKEKLGIGPKRKVANENA